MRPASGACFNLLITLGTQCRGKSWGLKKFEFWDKFIKELATVCT